MTNTKTNTGRLFARLIRLGRQDDAAFLLRYTSARCAANDNVPTTDGMGVDSELVMRPTIEDIRRASIKINGQIGLRFGANGSLSEYRAASGDGEPILNKDGEEIWLKPVERYKKPKGGRRKTSTALAADNNAHGSWLLSLRGTGKIPDMWALDTRYPSIGVAFERMKSACLSIARIGAKSENRDLLRWLGVDGGRTLEQCQEGNPGATVARCKPGMAWKVDFLCGKPEANAMATEGSFVGAPDAAELAMVAKIDASQKNAGARLEMALSGMTLREIAVAHGHNDNKGGEEWAARAVDRDIDDLKKSAA